jgi:hypothetical protein
VRKGCKPHQKDGLIAGVIFEVKKSVKPAKNLARGRRFSYHEALRFSFHFPRFQELFFPVISTGLAAICLLLAHSKPLS